MGFRIFIRTVIRKCRDTRLLVRLVWPDAEAAAGKLFLLVIVRFPVSVPVCQPALFVTYKSLSVINVIPSACPTVNGCVIVAKQ